MPQIAPPALNDWPLWVQLEKKQRLSRGWQSLSWSIAQLSTQPLQEPLSYPLHLVLYRGERLAYRFNLSAQVPKLFVVCEALPDESWLPRLITASQDEAADYMDAGQPVLDLPMPSAIHQWIDAFIRHHGEPEEHRKKRRYAQENEGQGSHD